MIDSIIIGDIDTRGRYLPAALTRLDAEAFLGHRELSALCNFQDPYTGRRLPLEDIEALHQAAREERGEEIPREVRQADLWDRVWEILEDAEGLSYITKDGIEWMIRRNANGDLVLVDETACKAVQHNTAYICQECRELIEEIEGDAEQEQRRREALGALNIDDEFELDELDEADEQWIGRVEEAGALVEDHCDACDCFAPLRVYVRQYAVERDYAELAAENVRPPADHGRELPHFDG